LEGERLPEYRVVVTEHTRHGVAKRHTFVLIAETWDEPDGPHWGCETDRPIRADHGLVAVAEPLPETIGLARGLDLPAPALVVVLEALVSGSRHHIDVADIKVIVSQLGSRITALDALSADQRRSAEPALYTEILRRCTTIELSG
jgi:hypothetical protein